MNGELSEDDIQLFPLLRNLTLVAGINWPSRVADYRDNMAETDTNQFVIINGDLILTRRGSLYSRVAAVFSFLLARLSLVTCCVVSDIDADFMSRTTMNKFYLPLH